VRRWTILRSATAWCPDTGSCPRLSRQEL
jgi:hypothetical protein